MALVIASEKSLASVECKTGNLIKSYKQTDNVKNGMTSISNGIFTIQKNKPVVHSYLLQKEAVFKRYIMPAKLSCISASEDGNYLAGGSSSGGVYLWCLNTGKLINMQAEAHFQAVNSIQWSKDSTCLVSCGEDARVLVWRLVDMINGSAAQFTLTSHTLPISACCISNGTFREARIYTASSDGTCCVFDLFSGLLLYTLVAEAKISSMVLDPAERAVYLGSDRGIHFVPLYVKSKDNKLISIASSDSKVVSTSDVESIMQKKGQVPVSALALSPDGTQVVAGMEDGQVISWDVGSKQLLKRYRSLTGKITQVLFVDKMTSTGIALPNFERDLNQQLPDIIIRETYKREPVHKDACDELAEIYGGNTETITVSKGTEGPEGPEGTEETNEETPSADSDKDAEIAQLKERNKQLLKMYDTLWAKYKSKSDA